jgi:hypothetical protein
MKSLNFNDFSVSQKITCLAIVAFATIATVVLVFSINQVVKSRNGITETVTSNRSLGAIEKIDRNFYERFGDVQAFAYNRLALQMADSSKTTIEGQNFINTMMAYYVLYDLMMVINSDGEVVALNTVDKSGVPVETQFLLGRNFSTEDWFRKCTSSQGPEGGAWFSDFVSNPNVAQIYKSNGQGMAFAAPIKNDRGTVIGVWYNFASWKEVTQGIRLETERQMDPASNAFIIITDKNGVVIDSSDEKIIGTVKVEEGSFAEGTPFNFNGRVISSEDYILGVGRSVGAYTYKGNNWMAMTFYPKMKFSLLILFSELLNFTLSILLTLAICIVAFLFLSKKISHKILALQNIVNTLGRGEFIEITTNSAKDEIGKMTDSIRSLIKGLSTTSKFANEIGRGNLKAEFEPLSENDVLGHSLLTMRSNLVKVDEDAALRNWTIQGLAKFAEILRNQDDFQKLGDTIISSLIKYVDANQGGLFIVNDDRGHEEHLELLSCYAWEKKKFIEMKVKRGEGLAGQCWQEGNPIYITDVPDEYIAIKSGLGKAVPTSILIMPLKVNENIYGVVEIASFKVFTLHEKEFVERVCENIAAAISSAKIADRTKRLLIESQQQTEEMRAQEEEMRQNMEELTAIQEEMGRKEQEYLSRIEELMASHGNGVASSSNGFSKFNAGHIIIMVLFFSFLLFFQQTHAQTNSIDSTLTKPVFNFSGYFDTYYFGNLNKPSTRNNLGNSGIARGFDRYVGQFQLGMFLTRINYSYKSTEVVGEIGFGPNVEYGSYGNDFRYKWGSVIANNTYSAILIKQAYINYKPTDKLAITMGQFGTHIGYEYIDAPLNFHYSINNTFNAGIPFYHVGLKATYSFNNKISLMGGVVNGTDNYNDNNRSKSFIGQFYVSPVKGMNVYFNTIQGNEANARSTGKDTVSYFGVLDFVATYQLTKRFLVGTWLMLGSLKGEYQGGAYTQNTKHWSGVNLYFTYKVNKLFSAGTRLEYFNNSSGARPLLTNGMGTTVKTLTLTGNFSLADGTLSLKPEFRIDVFQKMLSPSGEVNIQQFVDADGNFTKNSQSTIGMAAIYKF